MDRRLQWTGLILLLMVSVTLANEPTIDPSANSNPAPGSGATQFSIGLPPGRIVLRAKDPLVTRVLRRHRQSKSSISNNKSIRVSRPTKPISRISSSTAGGQSKPSGETELIKLEVPDTQPAVVNRSKRFVFKSISNTGAAATSGSKDLLNRQRQIELLRQAGKT